jgi:hypothetical protein
MQHIAETERLIAVYRNANEVIVGREGGSVYEATPTIDFILGGVASRALPIRSQSPAKPL